LEAFLMAFLTCFLAGGGADATFRKASSKDTPGIRKSMAFGMGTMNHKTY
jgi:hypothetical protein